MISSLETALAVFDAKTELASSHGNGLRDTERDSPKRTLPRSLTDYAGERDIDLRSSLASDAAALPTRRR